MIPGQRHDKQPQGVHNPVVVFERGGIRVVAGRPNYHHRFLPNHPLISASEMSVEQRQYDAMDQPVWVPQLDENLRRWYLQNAVEALYNENLRLQAELKDALNNCAS